MSIHKFGYSAESLQKDKIESLEIESESQTKLINIKSIDIFDKLEKVINLQNTELQVEEIQFINDKTQIVVNAKLFLDINKSIEHIKINLKYLEQDIKNILSEKKKEIISEAVEQANEQHVILRKLFERNLLMELEKSKNQAVKGVIQLLYNKGLFDSFENKDQYLMST